MKITELEIRSYRGIKATKLPVPPAGGIIKGHNGSGKTSVLNAIRAALAAQDIGPDAIHTGDDQAEIIVNLDALRVRRSITPKGSSLTVTNAEGDRWAKPQTRLNELLGTCALDPLGFFLADAKERRRMVLEALPSRVTEEMIRRWVPTADEVDMKVTSMHGLEAIDRLRKFYYDLRTEANRGLAQARLAERQAQAYAETTAAEAAELASTSGLPDGVGEAEAQQALEQDRARLHELKARASAAEASRVNTERTKRRVAELRAMASDAAAKEWAPIDEEETLARVAAAAAEVNRLKDQLAVAERALRAAEGDHEAAQRQNSESAAHRRRAAELTAQADELERSILSVAALDVCDDDFVRAEFAISRAKGQLDAARARTSADAARRAAALASDHLGAASKAAAELDQIVETLTKVAPAELSAAADTIPGLAVTDAGITLDGVAVDHLCGAEQMRFAIDLARRANAKAKILVVDGLERLDPEGFEAFVRYATRDGWQLIGTRVSAGEIVLEAIETDEEVDRG